MIRKKGVVYKSGPSNLAVVFLVVALLSWFMFVTIASFPVYAWLYYHIKPDASMEVSRLLIQEARDAGSEVGGRVGSNDVDMPEYDVSLYDGHWLIIPKIGVDTAIWEASYDEYEKAFKKGVWRVPDFGSPVVSGRPMILSAHRFGYLDWSSEYRKKNSFFNLPDLGDGDEVKVVWDKRVFRYEVVKVEEGEKISDYDVDLILYTCKFFTGPVRYFVYLKRI